MALEKSLTNDMLRSALYFQKFFAMVKINDESSIPHCFQHNMAGIAWDDWFGDVDDGKECTKFVCRYTSQGVHYYFYFGVKDYGPIKINPANEKIPFCALVANRGDEWFLKIFSNDDLKFVKDAVNSKNEEAVSFLGLTEIANNAREINFRKFSFIHLLEWRNIDLDSIFKDSDDSFKHGKKYSLSTKADIEADLKKFAQEYWTGQIEEATEALTLDPASASAYSRRGEAYRRKGRYVEAIKDLTEAIRLDPTSANAYGERGEAYRMKGQYDEAIKDLNEAIRLDPTSANAYGERGEAYRKKGQYAQAIEDLNEAIRLDPDNDFAYSGRGAVYQQLGKKEPAIQDFEKALSIDPDDEFSKNRLEELRKEPFGPNPDC